MTSPLRPTLVFGTGLHRWVRGNPPAGNVEPLVSWGPAPGFSRQSPWPLAGPHRGGENSAVGRLSLPSGGEKALTAVAMLVAIFRTRPSPFYIMDAVEAALDDANLRRLLGLFERLRGRVEVLDGGTKVPIPCR